MTMLLKKFDLIFLPQSEEIASNLTWDSVKLSTLNLAIIIDETDLMPSIDKIKTGDSLIIKGLTSSPHYNNTIATIKSVDKKNSERYIVYLANNEKASIHRSHLFFREYTHLPFSFSKHSNKINYKQQTNTVNLKVAQLVCSSYTEELSICSKYLQLAISLSMSISAAKTLAKKNASCAKAIKATGVITSTLDIKESYFRELEKRRALDGIAFQVQKKQLENTDTISVTMPIKSIKKLIKKIENEATLTILEVLGPIFQTTNETHHSRQKKKTQLSSKQNTLTLQTAKTKNNNKVKDEALPISEKSATPSNQSKLQPHQLKAYPTLSIEQKKCVTSAIPSNFTHNEFCKNINNFIKVIIEGNQVLSEASIKRDSRKDKKDLNQTNERYTSLTEQRENLVTAKNIVNDLITYHSTCGLETAKNTIPADEFKIILDNPTMLRGIETFFNDFATSEFFEKFIERFLAQLIHSDTSTFNHHFMVIEHSLTHITQYNSNDVTSYLQPFHTLINMLSKKITLLSDLENKYRSKKQLEPFMLLLDRLIILSSYLNTIKIKFFPFLSSAQRAAFRLLSLSINNIRSSIYVSSKDFISKILAIDKAIAAIPLTKHHNHEDEVSQHLNTISNIQKALEKSPEFATARFFAPKTTSLVTCEESLSLIKNHLHYLRHLSSQQYSA